MMALNVKCAYFDVNFMMFVHVLLHITMIRLNIINNEHVIYKTFEATRKYFYISLGIIEHFYFEDKKLPSYSMSTT